MSRKVIKAWAVINTGGFTSGVFENVCTIDIEDWTQGEVHALTLAVFDVKEAARAYADWLGIDMYDKTGHIKVLPIEITYSAPKNKPKSSKKKRQR